MKKYLLPLATLAMLIIPATANAAQCRDSSNGRFAKCGSPGSVPASQYVAKGKTSKPKAAAAAPRATASAKPGFFSRKPATPAAAVPAAKPSMAAKAPVAKAPAVRCRNAKGFAKCGTPGAKPM